MNNQKTLFVTRGANLSKEVILKYENLPYTKIILLYSGDKSIEKVKLPPKMQVIVCKNLNVMNREINTIYKNYPEYLVLPDFI
jgi:hypothetical protein